MQQCLRDLIDYIGDDPDREGLRETPARVLRSFEEMYSGYGKDPADVMTTFEDGACDEMVMLTDIEFYSACIVGSTFVDTPRGRIPIQYLNDGDFVYSFDRESMCFNIEQCRKPRVTKKQASLVRVYMDKESVLCTHDHKFLIYHGEGTRWARAKDLRQGDRTVSLSKGDVKNRANHKVIAVVDVPWKEDVWCMDVPNNQNFVANGVVVHNCEHHMLPFFGKAHIAYIPDGRVIGISKLARLLEIFSRRLQIQERIGQQITTAIDEHLKPKGSACVLEAQHFCMLCRGVAKQNSRMITSSLTGAFKEDAKTRLEFMNFIR